MVSRGFVGNRVRALVAFTILLLVCVVSSLIGSSVESKASEANHGSVGQIGVADAKVALAPEPPSEQVESSPAIPAEPEIPSGEEKGSAIPPVDGVGQTLPEARAIEAREAEEREQELATPAAVEERHASEYAYTDISAEQSEALLRDLFAEQLQAIDSDPSRVLADVTLERVDSPTEALVSVNGEKMLLESEVPLRAPEEDGDLGKVDLGLKQAARGYETANSVVKLSLPSDPTGPIEIGDRGLTITAEGLNPASDAQRFGREDLFLPSAAEDTDFLLSPITGGVDISTLLLSRKSPEQFSFTVQLPKDAELRASENGGAEVIEGKDRLLALVSPPHAVDAQGTDVPVALAVKGGSLILEALHRSMDIAYPILIDPQIEENWWEFKDTSKLNYWNWSWNGVGMEDYIGQRSYIVTNWGNGLYVRSRSNFFYPGGSYGRWWFTPQGQTTYMRRVSIGPMRMDAHGCTANEPHPYVGVYNNGGWWSVLNAAYPSGWATYVDTGEGNLGAGSRTIFVAIEAANNTNISCGRDYYLGGASLYLDDPENPSVNSVSGFPAGWTSDSTPFSFAVNASDPGLGVKSLTISPAGSPPLGEQQLGCDGHYSNPCPGSYTFNGVLSADSFDEGEKGVRLSAKDILGKFSNTSEVMLKVDRTPPEVLLSGQLATATQETEGDAKDPEKWDVLRLPVYNLTVQAFDGSNAIPATRRSGVKSIDVFLDQNPTPLQSWTQSCPNSSCGMTRSLPLKLNELTADVHHTLKVITKDFVGKERKREIEFEYIPATGMKDEYVMQRFPLPDGQGNEAEEEDPKRPELAVNVMNGNLVYRQRDVEVSGPAATLGVELFYNSLLPDAQDTEWGSGWTLAQTPTIEPDEPGAPGPVTDATMVQNSGAVESSIDLPVEAGGEHFDKNLQAVIAKEPGGGYALTDETGESDTELVFNEAGQTTQLRSSGFATVDYSYEGDELAEIAVDDPATVGGDPADVLERETLEDMRPTYKSSFGSQGTGNGQFKVLTDVATDPTDGTIWATDDDNDRLQHFTPAGEYLGKFATCTDPGAVEVDAKGDIYLACSASGSVRKYSDTGTLLKTLAIFGSGNAQVRFPLDLAFDSAGKLWVADSENDRIEQFDTAGNFVKAVPLGAWSRPWGIAVAPGGDIWVAEATNHRVSVFDQSGNVVRRFGSQGTGQGEFDRPSDVEIDQNGYVWVTDGGNNRVQAFTQEGEYVTQFGRTGSGEGQIGTYWWLRISVGPQGDIFISDQGNSRVSRWKEPNHFTAYKSSFGSQGTGNGQFKVLTDVATDPTDGTIWATDDDNDRLQHFTPAGEYLGKFATCTDPGAVEVDAKGDIYLACSASGSVRKYSDTGTLLKTLAIFGSGNAQVRFPLDLAFDSAGKLWVADSENDRIEQFDTAGNFVKAVPLGAWSRPWGIAVAPGGDIWVAEATNHRVSVFDQSGNVVRRFGSQGTGQGEFDRPSDVEIDQNGYVWVTDGGNNRVQAFTQEGEYVTQFGKNRLRRRSDRHLLVAADLRRPPGRHLHQRSGEFEGVAVDGAGEPAAQI